MAPLLHPVSGKVVPQPIHFSEEYRERALAQDREIIERIIAAYHHAVQSTSREVRQAMCGTIWSDRGLVGKQEGLIQALEEKSCARVHEILKQYFITDAAFGIAMGKREWEVVMQLSEHRRYYGLLWLDRLVGLAHAVGALSIPNPEDSNERWQTCLEVDPEKVFTAIENHVGVTMSFPNLCAVFGGRIRDRAFPFISFTHLLMGLSLRQMALTDYTTIYEIGGGFGGLAYWVCLLLPARYHIYDLPFASAVQAYFLHRALPDRKLALCGERVAKPVDITLMPAWAFLSQTSGTEVQMVVNQDSMPEMPQKIGQGYLEAMKLFLRGPFISVNQEPAPDASELGDRNSVANLVASVGGFKRVSRTPFFLRVGYVQEVYYPTQYRPYQWLATARRARSLWGLMRAGCKKLIRLSTKACFTASSPVIALS